MEFHLDDQVLNNAQAFERLADPSADKRREAAKKWPCLGNNARVLTMIMNMRVRPKKPRIVGGPMIAPLAVGTRRMTWRSSC